jgi:membrane-associated protein
VEILGFLLDFVLHVDQHLRQFVEQYGAWVYALLFLIVFVETGLVVMPFLPGDSLLFIVGALAGVGLMSYTLAVALLIAAAVLGNQTNYTIGSAIGPRVFSWEQSRLFNKRAFERAHAFYEEYGGITLVVARFLPFLRTFAPFVAGVAQMTRAKFTMYDVTGGTLWVVSIVTAGYLFGNLPWVQTHMSTIIWAMIVLPGLLALFGAWRSRRSKDEAQPGSSAAR